MKKLITLFAALFSYAAVFAAPTITGVTAQQRYPWNGKVDVAVTLSGGVDELSNAEVNFEATGDAEKVSLPTVHVAHDKSVQEQEGVISQHFVWDAQLDLGDMKVNKVSLTADALGGVRLWENGPYWATRNVGASAPEERGYYFWWGDTVGYKWTGSWVAVDGSDNDFYFTYQDRVPTYGKSVSRLQSSGYIGSAGNLVAKYDGATRHCGAPWHMPTASDFLELSNKCTTVWTSRNGVNGRLITGKGVYSSKSVFMPAVGSAFMKHGPASNIGEYWSSTPKSDSTSTAYCLYFSSRSWGSEYGAAYYDTDRLSGLPIRPVRESAQMTSKVAASLSFDGCTGVRVAAASETIRYSAAWESNAAGAVAEVAVDGTIIKSATGSGSVEWTPTRNGTYVLTHVVKVDGVQVGETLSATFVVEGLNPENPVITPESGTTFDSSLSVSMSCASEGATIHYTTDGSEPTMESPVYKRFRVSGKTTVKARAFYENGEGSEVVTAEYALGRCAEPSIVSAGGETFYHSGNVVTIGYDGTEGVVHYTTDGSEPTKESPVYEGSFTTDESMVVKAKAFSDNYFDSAVVTATLTREWETVATPVITAADSFTGAKTKVEIACATDGATIRYTLNGSDPNSHAKKYAGPFFVTEGCTIKAYAVLEDYTNSEIASKTITKVWGIGDSVALPDQKFTTSGDAEWVDVSGEAMKSGAITHNQKSILSTTFVGKGALSFKWKVSCEEDTEEHNWDHAAFFVDGVEITRQDGLTDWLDVTHEITSGGSHVVEWVYVKDEAESDNDDCMWVKDIVWMPERTQASEVKVETTWLKAYFPTLGSYYFDYEEKANETAANGQKVWEAYLIGLDPTDSAAKFVSSIAIEDGKPVVSWNPDLGGARAYTILGSTDLKTWTKVEEGRASDYNFFRVTVEMK